MSERPVDAAAIEAEVDQVRSLGIDALRRRWRMMFGAIPPPGLTKDIIARMIAYSERLPSIDLAHVGLP